MTSAAASARMIPIKTERQRKRNCFIAASSTEQR
jgi:hypothetical protein